MYGERDNGAKQGQIFGQHCCWEEEEDVIGTDEKTTFHSRRTKTVMKVCQGRNVRRKSCVG